MTSQITIRIHRRRERRVSIGHRHRRSIVPIHNPFMINITHLHNLLQPHRGLVLTNLHRDPMVVFIWTLIHPMVVVPMVAPTVASLKPVTTPSTNMAVYRRRRHRVITHMRMPPLPCSNHRLPIHIIHLPLLTVPWRHPPR